MFKRIKNRTNITSNFCKIIKIAYSYDKKGKASLKHTKLSNLLQFCINKNYTNRTLLKQQYSYLYYVVEIIVNKRFDILVHSPLNYKKLLFYLFEKSFNSVD